MKIVRIIVYIAVAAAAIMATVNAVNTGNTYMDVHTNVKTRIESYFSALPFESYFMQSHYGYLRATNRGHFNGVTFLTDGRLMLDTLENRPFLYERADAILELRNYLNDEGIPFLYVRVPNKIQDNTLLPVAFSDNNIIANADFLFNMLDEYGVDTIDLRDEMIKDDIDFTSAFFQGDHHWTADTALWAFGKIANFANREYGFQIDEMTWDPRQYERVTFEQAFLGEESMAVHGLHRYEDITALYPRFHTELTVTDNYHGRYRHVEAMGSFADVFLPKINNEHDGIFNYLDLNVFFRSFMRYENAAASERKHVLLIVDSMGIPLSPYFSTAFGIVDDFYLAHGNNQRLWSAINQYDYDLVVFVLSDIVISNDNAPVFEHDRLFLGHPPG